MTLVVNIKEGKIDFVENLIATPNLGNAPAMTEEVIVNLRKRQCLDVNPYWYHEHFSGKAKDFLKELLTAMNDGNHDRSDIMTDYFDVGWYVDVNIGKWNKPYKVAA